MTVLVGGLRVLGAMPGTPNTACSPNGGNQLTNDFFVNLLDMGSNGNPLRMALEGVYEGATEDEPVK